VYWKYGGATVFTNKAIRLTPATQDRQGWLWNDFPLENADWEIAFSIKPGLDSLFPALQLIEFERVIVFC
jgi:hypothetical protein